MRQGNLFFDYKFCFVCDQPIKNGSIYIGNGLYRHESCAPGRLNWLKSPRRKNSEFKGLWTPSDAGDTEEQEAAIIVRTKD